MKKCNGCKRELDILEFTLNDKIYARCNNCTSSCKNNFCKTCGKKALFGYSGSTPSHCSKHKLEYMIKNPKRTCIGDDIELCDNIAIYGEKEPLYCEDHKSRQICWLLKKCYNCGRDNVLLIEDGLCGICCSK